MEAQPKIKGEIAEDYWKELLPEDVEKALKPDESQLQKVKIEAVVAY